MPFVTTREASEGVVVLTLDDPPRRNAISAADAAEMRRRLLALDRDAAVRSIVLTGAGSAFSAGGDLDMLDDHVRSSRAGEADVTLDMLRYYRALLTTREVGTPVVAAVNGAAIGAGFCLAMSCDLVVVAEDAHLGATFVRLGVHPGAGATWLLPRLTNAQSAADLLLTGRIITGEEAFRRGLALEATPRDRTLARALELAEELSSAAPMVVADVKRALAGSLHRSLDSQLEIEARNQAASYGTDDALEGLTAVREKRRPRFAGN